MATLVLSLFGIGSMENLTDALWSGPDGSIEWIGFVDPVLDTQDVSDETTISSQQGSPVWVGYYSRADQWWVRLRLFGSQLVESVALNSTTSDGWALVDFVQQGHRLRELTLQKDGKTITLELQK